MIQLEEGCKERLKEIVGWLNKNNDPKSPEAQEAVKKLRKSLRDKLIYLHTYSCRNERGELDLSLRRCRMYPDHYDDFDFNFVLENPVKKVTDAKVTEWQRWFNGGMVFHGAHNGYGSGGFLTSVCVEPTHGWAIHT